MKVSSKLSLAAASAAAIILMTPGVSFADDMGIWNSGSGKCLEIDGSSRSNGARAQQWSCNGQAGSFWRLESAGNGLYEIVNENSGKCLEVADSSRFNGAAVQQWTCVGNDTQKWQIVQAGDRSGNVFVNYNSGKVLEVEDSGSWNGARIQQWEHYPSVSGQVWNFGRNPGA
ncbi:arabinogalactan endo-1,4-beta-galactosidase [Streptomyces rectiverticillatus]|uniref:RICIN domain-containing protein n=1 Tax=Streptomyces rectiverticillatus TaxID=173860 RepID=UPI0015C360D0|nr:RICIN domain-containing protein [Streptomyces rectiverticillatus]QLE73448.1 arabinogalactan endo-1,4-beta-galactosidase [Streptomyces rectiverticillatus]